MGFHTCTYCTQLDSTKWEMARHPATSSGDVRLTFADEGQGHIWEMPNMILHYVRDHGYQPLHAFIEDVMHGRYLPDMWREGVRLGLPKEQVGYLTGDDWDCGTVPDGFVWRLGELMQQAREAGDCIQTRGV